MPKPSMGAKIPGFEMDKVDITGQSSAGSKDYMGQPILNALNNQVGATPNNTTQQQTPQVQWGQNSGVELVANPNEGFTPIQSGIGGPGLDPNINITPGVATYNTPSTNSQGTPGFGLNNLYQTQPDASNVISSLKSNYLGTFA